MRYIRTPAQFAYAHNAYLEPPDDSGVCECPECRGTGMGPEYVFESARGPQRLREQCEFCNGQGFYLEDEE